MVSAALEDLQHLRHESVVRLLVWLHDGICRRPPMEPVQAAASTRPDGTPLRPIVARVLGDASVHIRKNGRLQQVLHQLLRQESGAAETGHPHDRFRSCGPGPRPRRYEDDLAGRLPDMLEARARPLERGHRLRRIATGMALHLATAANPGWIVGAGIVKQPLLQVCLGGREDVLVPVVRISDEPQSAGELACAKGAQDGDVDEEHPR
mmetsp:Transcript_80261/g.233060  ORF Transcript_80261/g.233060 Transcript_80261/m.233060 type:complete len:208 (-) Transcript_80261:404-1027(-)